MHDFFSENKRYLQLLVVTLMVISVFVFVIIRSENIVQAVRTLINVLKPFIYGFVIAYLVKPLVFRFEKLVVKLMKSVFHKEVGGCRGVAVLTVFVLLIAIIVLAVYAVIPGLISSIRIMAVQIPKSIQDFEAWLENVGGSDENGIVAWLTGIIEDGYNSLFENIQSRLLPSLENILSSLTAGFGGVLTVLKNFGLGCIVAIYMLFSWEKYGAQSKVLLYGFVPAGVADWVISELVLADKLFGGFISGKIVDSTIIGVICFVVMIVLDMPYAMLISVIVGVTNIIPFFGPYIGAIPSAILVLTVNPVKCLIFIVFIIILQQFDGNLIGPKILGDKVGISSFWILFSILFFGSYWGVIGMIVGVPIFGLLYDLVKRIMHQGLEKHGKTELYTEYSKEYAAMKKESKKNKKKGKFGFINK